MHDKAEKSTAFTAVGFAVALVFGIVPLRVPFEPTAYSSAGRNHLTYELYLATFSSSPVTLRRIEMLDADDLAPGPIAAFEAGQLDALVQTIGA
jgi:hypothetical protein